MISTEQRTEDYFTKIKAELISGKSVLAPEVQALYEGVEEQIRYNKNPPTKEIAFGTSGWRGILGIDINVRTVSVVTQAIVSMYRELESNNLQTALQIQSFEEVQSRGCVVGRDNRFGGEILLHSVVATLVDAGIKVYYAGESTTGVLSATVLELDAAFSINLTPSHNPLEYGGYKFNGADAGPAAKEVTSYITTKSRELIQETEIRSLGGQNALDSDLVEKIDSLQLWRSFVSKNKNVHSIDIETLEQQVQQSNDLYLVIDSVHGASRLHTKKILGAPQLGQIHLLRDTDDVTFGGVAPEPSSANLENVVTELNKSNKALKLGAIIDPDGDRIRFTDGNREISMNQFGAIAYHFLHQQRNIKGMVAKSVASSNLANSLAKKFGEKAFEPAVGFKEFKPVLSESVVCFEESDGISIIGHTPEKDAYIGLLLAVDIVLSSGMSLGAYLENIEKSCGAYFPQVDSVGTSLYGENLTKELANLDKIKLNSNFTVSGVSKEIVEIINLDGHKFVLEDGSWLLIRPSGTEPKIRLYVEAREKAGRDGLLALGRSLLKSLGLI